MKLNRCVGKNCFAPPGDVSVVQAALGHIKARTKFGTRPLWDPRKIDGKNSRELVDAIACFQQLAGVPITGKIEPSGRCIAALRQKLPAPVRAQLAQAGGAGTSGVATSAPGSFRGRLLKSPNNLFPSQQLIDFLKGWEGMHRFASPDAVGNCTIGHGHLLYPGPCNGTDPLEIKHKNGISDADAEELLRRDVADAIGKVKRRFVTKKVAKVTQSMFDALVALTFNADAGPQKGTRNSAPKLWDNLSAGDFVGAAREFLDIDKAKNQAGQLVGVSGLTKRRRAESDMFLNANYSGRS